MTPARFLMVAITLVYMVESVRTYVSNTHAHVRMSVCYKKHENIKKRAYGQCVRDIEHGVFTPLVFSTTGGIGQEACTFYKRLAYMLSCKQQKSYSLVISWLRCKLSFAAIRSSIMCIRGTRSSNKRPLRDADDITLATSEGDIPQV